MTILLQIAYLGLILFGGWLGMRSRAGGFFVSGLFLGLAMVSVRVPALVDLVLSQNPLESWAGLYGLGIQAAGFGFIFGYLQSSSRSNA